MLVRLEARFGDRAAAAGRLLGGPAALPCNTGLMDRPWRSPLWRKAPVALFWHRSALAAVVAAGLLVALAASSAPFVTTASASAELKSNLARLSPLATGLEVQWAGAVTRRLPALERLDKARTAGLGALARRLHLGAPILTLESAQPFQVNTGSGERIILMARTGALSHVQRLGHVPGPGVWISDLTARDTVVRPGGHLRLEWFARDGTAHRISLRVKGVYRALDRGDPGPYWADFLPEILPQGADPPPPARYVFMRRDELLRVAAGLQGLQLIGAAEMAVDPAGLTLARARSLAARFDGLQNTLPASSLGGPLGCDGPYLYRGPDIPALSPCSTSTSLSSAVGLADRAASEISPGVSLLSVAGTAIALAIAAAAGVFLTRRRGSEAALHFARGEQPLTYTARTALEVLFPALLGAAAGFGIASALTRAFAPSGSIESATVASALARAGFGAAAAVALAAGAAGVLFVRQFDSGGSRLTRLRRLPWELPLLAVALWLLVSVLSGGGLARGAAGAAGHPTVAVFLFPLLLVAAAAGLVMRLLRPALRRRRSSDSALPVAAFLALRRLTAAQGVLTALVVVSAVAFGAYFYAQALAASLDHDMGEKAYVAYGGDVQALSSSARLPRRFPFPVTSVTYGQQAARLGSADGAAADVFAVDPATLPAVIRWYSDWGPDPRRELATLDRGGDLRAVATRDVPPGTRAVWLEGTRVPVTVVARVRAFPGMSPGVPLLAVSRRALDGLARRLHLYEPLGTTQTYLWAKGPPHAVSRALAQPAVGGYFVSTVESFRDNPDVVLARRTFTYMRLVAGTAGVLVCLGLLLYLQARQRSQAVGSALAARMGLRRRDEVLSLSLELLVAALLAAAVGAVVALVAASPIVPHLDPIPDDAPGPVLLVPWLAIAVATLALALLVPVAGAITTRASRRTDMSEALRVA